MMPGHGDSWMMRRQRAVLAMSSLGAGVWPLPGEFVHDFDAADDVVVELVEVFSGDPQFEDRLAACLADRVAGGEPRADAEPGDVTGAAGGDVPVTGDL